LEWLVNPHYLIFLFEKKYFSSPAFKLYLAKLKVLAQNNMHLLRFPEVLAVLEIVSSDGLTSFGLKPLLEVQAIANQAIASRQLQ
jgi:hypothetical protein